MPALTGEHFCKEHQGNSSHYAKENCALCKLQKKYKRVQKVLEELSHADSLGCVTGDCPHETVFKCVEAFAEQLKWVSNVAKRAEASCRYCKWNMPLSYDGKTHWFDGAGEVQCEAYCSWCEGNREPGEKCACTEQKSV
jgi:hypothetical protein